MKEHHEKHGTEKRPAKGFFEDPWRVGLSLLVIVLLAYIAINSGNTTPVGPPSGGNQSVVNKTVKANVTIELFVMSQCPYGVQAEGLVKNVIDTFGGEVNLSLHFIANEGANGSFTSLHGQNEVDEDLRQVCIIKYYPQNTLINYLSCVEKNYTQVGQIWEGCASQNQIDVNVIKGCSAGIEGKTLLSDNMKRTGELGVGSSPTIYLNGTLYGGGRDESSMARSICTLIPGSSNCKNLPPEVSVELTVVNDKNCLLCDPTGIENSLQGMIYNLSIKELEYSSAEGRALLQKFNISGVPAYIFNSSITQHSSYGQLSRYLQGADNAYLLLVQPVELLNMAEKNNTIQLFVMSMCPYGTMAEKALKEALDAMPDLKFSGLRFIANEGANGSFTSLHGQNEVDEDLRQVCIIKYYPEKILNYTFCIAANYSNAGSIWERCANESSMSPVTIRNCSSGAEGKALMKDNIALSNSLQIYSSPTLLLNNNTMFSTVQADQIRQAVCAYDSTLRGCNKTLSGAGTTAPSGGCG